MPAQVMTAKSARSEAAADAAHDIAAEQRLLGALLYDNRPMADLPGRLRAEDFWEPLHQRLFREMAAQVERGELAEPILVAETFATDPAFHELGGLRYLADLVDRAPTGREEVLRDAMRIQTLALARQVFRLIDGLSEAAAPTAGGMNEPAPSPLDWPASRPPPPAVPMAVSLLGPNGDLDIDQVADLFSMTQSQLADTVGLSRETLSKAKRRTAAKTRGRLTEMLEIISRIEAWAGGRHQALAWYRAQPIPALGDRTAEAMVKTGEAGLVRDYLDHIALGGFA